MSEANLFKNATVRVNDKCVTVELRESPPTCGYFCGKPGDGNCKRCGQSWQAHYPSAKEGR
jgi:hypothetical protein